MSFGKELVESAREVLAIAEDKFEPAKVHIPDAIDVAAIRSRLDLSQTEFSSRFDPQAWLADVLTRMPDMPVSRLPNLLPWNWKPQADRQKAA